VLAAIALAAVLLALSVMSWIRGSTVITPTTGFAALWFIGAVACVLHPLDDISWATCAIVALATCLLFGGECLVQRPEVPPSAVRRPGSARGRELAYWTLTVIAICGAAWKLHTSLEYVGESWVTFEAMFATTALRGAVTSSDLTFPPAATAMVSAMYVAAAMAGFQCYEQKRLRYAAHAIPAALDSLATAGRGSFLLVCVVTGVGLAVTWTGSRRRALIATIVSVCAVVLVVLGLSAFIGREDASEMLWEYIVGPLYGLGAYERLRPASGIAGPSLIAALSGKLGGRLYDAGSFVWTRPFVGNVSSGFHEVLNDVGVGGVAVFVPLGALCALAHRAYLKTRHWGSYAVCVALYAFLVYFYYISLSAFLPGWWVLLTSGVVAPLATWLWRHFAVATQGDSGVTPSQRHDR
jgi:oligosaccharide repeat unit polymerase